MISPATALAIGDTTEPPSTSGNTTGSPPRPVEAGPGGEIKLERKYRTQAENQYQWHAHYLHESRYVTEGRDNLSGNSINSLSTEFTAGEFSIVPWLASGSGVDYTEFDLNIIYGIKVRKGLSVYLGYTYIQTHDNNLNNSDNELSIDIASKLAEHVNLLTSIYHSFDAAGSFVETAIKYARPLSDKLHLSAQAVFGINAGYVADGHRGLNHAQLRSTMSYQPSSQIELYAYLSASQSINKNSARYAGDVLLKNMAWAGAGFSYLF